MNLVQKLTSALVVLQSINSVVSQSIYAIPNPPKWPVMMTVTLPPNMALTNPTYKWEFPASSSQACTVEGRANVSPCVGKVVDHVFETAGMHQIKVTITDSSLSNPSIVTLDIDIKKPEDFPTVERPEIRHVDDDRWTRYLTALYILKETGFWDHLSLIHRRAFAEGRSNGTRRGAAHAGPSFLFWHRAQMRVIERAIQHASGDNSLGLPYFDWTKGWTGVEKFFGGDGDPNNDYIVTSGPFCNDPTATDLVKCPKKWVLPSEYPHPSRAIQRKFGNDTSFHFQTNDEFNRLLSIQQYDVGPFDDKSGVESFRSALEGWPTTEKGDNSAGYNHNGLHRYIGGTMGRVEFSLNDPMFVIHHCDVDRLATMWQERHYCADGKNTAQCYRPQPGDPDLNSQVPGATTENGQTVLAGQMPDSLMYPWNMKVSDLFKANQGYLYLPSDQSPTKLDAVTPNRPNPTLGNRTETGGIFKNDGVQTQPNLFTIMTAFISVLSLIM